MSSRGNVQSEKCPVGEIAARASVWSGKCQVGEVSVGELSSQGCVSRESVGRGNVQSGKCPDPVQHLYRGLLKTKTKKNSADQTPAQNSLVITSGLLIRSFRYNCTLILNAAENIVMKGQILTRFVAMISIFTLHKK